MSLDEAVTCSGGIFWAPALLPEVWATSVVLPLKVSTVVSAASHGPLPRPPGHPCGTVSHAFLGPGGPKSCAVAWNAWGWRVCAARLGHWGEGTAAGAERCPPRLLAGQCPALVTSGVQASAHLPSVQLSPQQPWALELGCLAYRSFRRAGACPRGLPPLPRPLRGCRPQSDAFPATLSRYVGSSL